RAAPKAPLLHAPTGPIDATRAFRRDLVQQRCRCRTSQRLPIGYSPVIRFVSRVPVVELSDQKTLGVPY
ncbi:MAG: hypothetical protein JSW67_01825, partial [Candidatus Latescibacterota bacterium]